MKRVLPFIALFIVLGSSMHPLFAQRRIEKEKGRIMGEGLALYTLVLANWTSNDLYYENEYNTGYIKGYLTYKDKDTLKTIFWRETDTTSEEYKAQTYKAAEDTGALAAKKTKKITDLRVIVKTISYKKINVTRTNAAIGEEEREPTAREKMLMDFRALAYKTLEDTSFFKQYEGVQLKAIPMEAGRQIIVYVYSATAKEDVVPIGGDYLLVFDKKEKSLVSKKDLHHDFMFISTHYKGRNYDASKSTQHTHKEGASELITPTDIATLLLYKSQLEWDEHFVVGKEYTCIFTLIDRKLDIIPTEEYEKMNQKMKKKEDEEKKTKMR